MKQLRSALLGEEYPFIFDVSEGGLVKFEWFFSAFDKSTTLIEVIEDAEIWGEVGNKVIGNSVNVKFNEFFTMEKLTLLGDVSNSFKAKLLAMKPIFKSYLAGFGC